MNKMNSSINNSLDARNETKPFDMTRFIVLETSNSILSLIALYLLIAFIAYECRRPVMKRWRSSIRSTAISPTGKSNRYAISMRIQSVFAALCLLGRFVCQHYEFIAQYTGAYTYDYCDVILKIKFIFTSLSILCIYGFLWTRQRFCYSDPAMNHLTSCTTKIFSWLSMILILLAQVVGTFMFTFTRFYKLTYQGCYPGKTTIPAFIPWLWIAVCTVGFQVMLLCLFIYPLIKHRTMVSTNIRGVSRSFLPLIKRATVTTTICILTDTIGTLLILLVNDKFNIVPTLVFDISLTINIICVLGAFKGWKTRLCSPCYCFRKSKKFGKFSSEGANTSVKMSGRIKHPIPDSSVWSVTGGITSPKFHSKVAFENTAVVNDLGIS